MNDINFVTFFGSVFDNFHPAWVKTILKGIHYSTRQH